MLRELSLPAGLSPQCRVLWDEGALRTPWYSLRPCPGKFCSTPGVSGQGQLLPSCVAVSRCSSALRLCQPRVLLRGRNRGDNQLFIPWQLGWRFPNQLSDSVEIPNAALQELSQSTRTCSWFGNIQRAEPKAFGQCLAVQGPTCNELEHLGSNACGEGLA